MPCEVVPYAMPSRHLAKTLRRRPVCHAYYYSHFLLVPCLLVPWHALTAARASSNFQLTAYYRPNLPVHPRVDRVLHNPDPDPDH